MADARRRRLRVLVTDANGRRLGGVGSASVRGLGPWLARVAPSSARGAVGVALVSDARVRALNLRYRRKDKVTDVLSFPAEARLQPRRTDEDPWLGDVVIARGVARRQARQARHAELTELKILALHG